MKTLLDKSIEKSRSGVYQDTSENRRLHRVGQHYGEAKKPDEEVEKKSKREQREERLNSYKKTLSTIEEALKGGKVAPENMDRFKGLKETLEGKIAKLEEKLGRKKAEPQKKAEKKPEDKQLTEHNVHAQIKAMAKNKAPEFIKRGKIDPNGDPDWEKKSDAIDWDKVDIAAMGQTIEYLGKIGRDSDGSDLYGIRYYSPNGKHSDVMGVSRADYLRDVKAAGFDIKESMKTAVDFIDPDNTSLTRDVAKMILESKTPAEIRDYVIEKRGGNDTDRFVNKIIERGQREAEAAQIRMENDALGVKAPTYDKDESDPIPDGVKKLNSRSDMETIHEEVAKWLGLEVGNTYWGVKNSSDISDVMNFVEYRRGKGLSKTAIIEKLKTAYTNKQKTENEQRSVAATKAYLSSPEGRARAAAYKQKAEEYRLAFKNSKTVAEEGITEAVKVAGIELSRVEAYDGSARLYIKDNGSWSDAEVYYREKFDSDQREYEVQTSSYGAVAPGSSGGKSIALQGALLSNEKLIESVKRNLLALSSAAEVLHRKMESLRTQYSDLFVGGSGEFGDGESGKPLREIWDQL